MNNKLIMVMFCVFINLFLFMHFYDTWQFILKNSNKVNETIAEIIEVGNYSGNPYVWGYKYLYYDHLNNRFISKSDSYSPFKNRFKIGEKIGILYLINDSSKSKINTFDEIYLGNIFLLILDIYFLYKLYKQF